MKKVIIIAMCMCMLFAFSCAPDGIRGDEDGELYADGDQYEYIGGELNVLNWGEYIDPELIDLFEEETGVKVNYIEMTSNEEMLIKLRSPDCVYDMCFPSDYIIEKLIASDMLYPLDKEKIPNIKNIDQKMLDITDTFDAGNTYSVPYMWGTVGILYNKTLVDEPVTSWNILWDEKYAGQIWMYDSLRDSIAVSLLRLGYDINTRSEEEVAKARDELIAQKPLTKGYGTDNIRTSMINGKAALAVIYSGDAFCCIDQNPDLDFAVPEEGSNVWFDNVVIPKTAKNIEAAHAFINFLNDAKIAARNTEFIYYSTPNAGAMALLDDYFTKNETFNPSDETLARCTIFHDLGEFIEVFNAAWDSVKSAKVN